MLLPASGQALEGDDMGVALRTTGSGQRRLVFLPARGDRQGRGMEVMDAYLASRPARGSAARGVSVWT